LTSSDDSPVADYPSMLQLAGRNLMVVGAGQGMGRQTSHALARCGATVLCVDIVPRLADEIAAEVNGIAWSGDVTKEREVIRLVEEATRSFGGPIHGFVDIVGMSEWAELVDTEEQMRAWPDQQGTPLQPPAGRGSAGFAPHRYGRGPR
jgi:NAD(P)-dependent dehydrogenase (short-subunit alcohol dehydrogenase family)